MSAHSRRIGPTLGLDGLRRCRRFSQEKGLSEVAQIVLAARTTKEFRIMVPSSEPVAQDLDRHPRRHPAWSGRHAALPDRLRRRLLCFRVTCASRCVLLSSRETLNERELDGLMNQLGRRRPHGLRASLRRTMAARHCRCPATPSRRTRPTTLAKATMLKLFAHTSEFRRGSPVLRWFYAIAANENPRRCPR